MRIYKAPIAAPTLVFNHGSTGSGTDPSLFARPQAFSALAQFFVQRGRAVVPPAHGGRGRSEGQYDEGFASDRSLGYSCDPALSIPGADRALCDADAAIKAPRHDRAASNGEETVIEYLLLARRNYLVHNSSSLARTVLLKRPEMLHANTRRGHRVGSVPNEAATG
jgi:hypothetical protein